MNKTALPPSLQRQVHSVSVRGGVPRGRRRGRPGGSARPHLHGRHGLRHGQLLPAGTATAQAWSVPRLLPFTARLSVFIYVLQPPHLVFFFTMCLQVTFQACSIDEARYLYDQLATFCPIVVSGGMTRQDLAVLPECLKPFSAPQMTGRGCFVSSQMALSAASPFYRGYVSDIDCRWGVISASVDDRTQEERGLKVSRRSRKTTWCKKIYALSF